MIGRKIPSVNGGARSCGCFCRACNIWKTMAPRRGFEPATSGLQVRYHNPPFPCGAFLAYDRLASSACQKAGQPTGSSARKAPSASDSSRPLITTWAKCKSSAQRQLFWRMADCLDVVAVWIPHECTIIGGMIVRTQAWRTVILAARRYGRRVELVDFGAALC